MALLKLSEIATTASNMTASDHVIAVQGTATDVQFSAAQIAAYVLTNPFVNGALGVSGGLSVDGGLTVGGALTAASSSFRISGAGAVTIDGTLTANGTVNGPFSISGALTADTATINGTLTSSNATVNGTLTSSNATVNGTLTAVGPLIAGSSLNVGGAVLMGAAATVNGLLTANSGLAISGATTGGTYNGVTLDNNAWTAYTPTITAGSGTFTTASGTGRYKQIGKTVFIYVQVVITTNGTAGTFVNASLPVNATQSNIIVGREQSTGVIVQGVCNAGVVSIVNAAGTYPGGSGTNLYMTGVYEA